MKGTPQTRLAVGVLIGLVTVAAWRDATVSTHSAVAPGIDGYYYVVQVNELASHCRLYIPSRTPLILYAIAAVNHFLGNPVISIKIASLALQVLLCLAVCAVINAAVNNLWFGILGSSLTVIPQSHFYLTSEFLSTLGALVLLLLAGWRVIRAVQTKRSIWFLMALIFLIGALFSHQLILVLAPTIAFFCLAIRWWKLNRRLKNFVFLALAIIWLLPAAMLVQPFVAIPAWFERHFSLWPRWSIEGVAGTEAVMLAIVSFALLLLIAVTEKATRPCIFDYVFGSVALWSLVVTLNPFLNASLGLNGLAGRLRVLSYLQVALILPGLIWLLHRSRRELTFYLIAVLTPLLLMTTLQPLPRGMQPDFLIRREQLIDALKRHVGRLDRESIVLASHGNQFVVTATTGMPSQQYPPERLQFRSVYWLLTNVDDPILAEESIVLLTNDGRLTVVVSDDQLKKRLLVMDRFEKALLLNENPHLMTVLRNDTTRR